MTPATRILGTYKIQYANGVTQYSNLISHDDFLKVIQPTKDRIAELLSTKKKDDANVARFLKGELKSQFSDNFFTDKSPMYNAIATGILSLPEHQGGDHKCIVKLVAEDIVLEEAEED